MIKKLSLAPFLIILAAGGALAQNEQVSFTGTYTGTISKPNLN